MKSNIRRTIRWQRKIEKLTTNKLLSALKQWTALNLLLHVLLFFVIPLVILADILLLLYTDDGSLWILLTCAIALIDAIFGFSKQIRNRKKTEEHQLFEKYGNPETVVHRLQSGAEQVLFDTKLLVLTKSYILVKQNYASYIPYDNLTEYYIDHGIIAALLTQGEQTVKLFFTDNYGDTFHCELIGNERNSLNVICQILHEKAPHAANRPTGSAKEHTRNLLDS